MRRRLQEPQRSPEEAEGILAEGPTSFAEVSHEEESERRVLYSVALGDAD